MRRYIVGGFCVAALALSLLPRLSVQGSEEKAPVLEIVLREALVIPAVGRSGRSAVHTDTIEALIVAGKWTGPKAGDEVKLPDGASRKWEAAKANNDGWLDGPALRGGYAFVTVPSDQQKVMLLEASGHNMVYVNGEPRTGDPYSTGYVRLPVLLRRGDNEFLFHVGRGRLRAKLVAAKAAAQLDTGDVTSPDFIVGKELETWAAVPVLNNRGETLQKAVLEARVNGGEPVRTPLGTILAHSLRKCGFRLLAPAIAAPGEATVKVSLFADDAANDPLDSATLKLRVVSPIATRKVTFVSSVDGSVQYYAVTPMANSTLKPGEKPALFLTLHGAGVEALGQASCYSNKTWGHMIAPTNRRPYGFDWEDWGRLDAMEVLDHGEKSLGTDPRRTYLTGHSMGGHGVWHLGATYPERWAAIAPSAGWISMYSYAGARRPENPDPRQEMLTRAASPSDTLALLKNYNLHGIFVLHGEKDDNVPVTQAREMRKQLATFHSDFTYYERPGAGHWWGNECVDWPPMLEFFARHAIPDTKSVRHVEFTTVNPGVSAKSHWVTIEAQQRALQPSSARLTHDAAKRTFAGTTENVARISLDLDHLKPSEPVTVELDGQKLASLPWPERGKRLWLERQCDKWTASPNPAAAWKGPHRNGPFKDAFRHRMLFVYGTKGSPEENAWAFAKARFDAETFWYRGNGSIDVIRDIDFDDQSTKDRSVILFGNADTNAAWPILLKGSPVQVRRGEVHVGDRSEKADDLACLFLRSRPDSDNACVAVIAGTGLSGMRLTDRLPYFVSGVGIPDLLEIDSSMLTRGRDGIRVAGFFGNDWSVEKGEFAWRP